MNFEEYIKKPFEDQEFEFKEAYWQSAEKLIDNHYKRVRWIRAGIICSILIATFIASYIYVSKKEISIPNPVVTQQQNIDPINNNQEISTQTIQPTSSEENITLSGTDTDAEPLSSDNIDSNIEKASTDAEIGKPKVAAANNVTMDSRANSEKSIKSGQSSGKSAKISTSGSNHLAATTAGSDPRQPQATDDKKAFQNNKSEVILTEDNIAANDQDAVQNNSAIITPVNSETPKTFALHPVTSQRTSALDLPFKNIESSGSLQMLNFPLHLDFGTNRPILALNRPSRLYAAAELLMYPSGNSEAFKFLGFNAGFGYQQPLGQMAFLDMGISGSFRRGNFAPSIVSTQLNYDFGPRTDAYILRPQALFSLQVPVLLGVEHGRHMLAAGVKLGFLIGVRGTSEYANYTHAFESPTGQESYSYDVVDKGWIESTGFKKFALAYALKYQYRLNSRIMAGVSLQYLPSDWIANDFGKYYNFTSNEYQKPAGNPAQLIERNWLLGVELKYVLFSKN